MPRSVAASLALSIAVITGCSHSSKATIEQRSEQVMPFNMSESMHMFTPNASGGTQEVVVHDGNQVQIALVRRHLQMQAADFTRGDFSNPAYIHGNDMPGLKELERDHSRMTVKYSDTSLGGEITYSSTDPRVVAAVHQWFDAQVRDHGEHSTMH